MKPLSPTLFAFAATLAASTASAAEAPNVVASIKPLHSLVSAIMKGVGAPALVVEGGASPHTYSLKPSNAAALQDADVVFWIGHGLEAFLEKPLEALPGKAVITEMEEVEGLERLAFREGGAFEAHDHADEEDGDHDDHEAHDDHDDHEAYDMHLWLNPMNAKAMAMEIEKVLASADPANADTYHANGVALQASIDALDTEIAAIVEPIKDKPFVVFHDAYQYFEKRYHITVAGSVTVSPETMPGAERLTEIHDKIAALGATCVFSEPQFEPKLIRVVTEGTTAKAGVLDPLGTEIADGPDLYPQLIRNLATSLKTCLQD